MSCGSESDSVTGRRLRRLLVARGGERFLCTGATFGRPGAVPSVGSGAEVDGASSIFTSFKSPSGAMYMVPVYERGRVGSNQEVIWFMKSKFNL